MVKVINIPGPDHSTASYKALQALSFSSRILRGSRGFYPHHSLFFPLYSAHLAKKNFLLLLFIYFALEQLRERTLVCFLVVYTGSHNYAHLFIHTAVLRALRWAFPQLFSILHFTLFSLLPHSLRDCFSLSNFWLISPEVFLLYYAAFVTPPFLFQNFAYSRTLHFGSIGWNRSAELVWKPSFFTRSYEYNLEILREEGRNAWKKTLTMRLCNVT